MRDISYLIIVLSIIFSWQVFAEVGNNPFAGQTVIRNNQNQNPQNSSVGAAGGQSYVGGHLADPNDIQDNSAKNATVGRREKTVDSVGQGGAGIAGAIVAGVNLTADGVSKLPWPTTPQGLALIALGSLEFVQAGLTAGATASNEDGRDVLRYGTTSGSQSNYSPEMVKQQIKKQIDTPELQQILTENGVNSDHFVEQLASGEFTTPEQVMQAMNIPQEISSDALEQAMNDVAQNFSAGEPEGRGKNNDSRVKVVEDNAHEKVNGKSPTRISSRSDSVETADPIQSNVGSEKLAGQDNALLAKAEKMADKALAKAAAKGDLALLGMTRDTLIQKYLAQLKNKKNKRLKKMTHVQLAQLGIKRLRRKQNIFHISRLTYRTYGKWRKQQKKKQKGRLAHNQTVVR